MFTDMPAHVFFLTLQGPFLIMCRGGIDPEQLSSGGQSACGKVRELCRRLAQFKY